MKIEIPIDPLYCRMGDKLNAHIIADTLNKECRRIINQHKQDCQNEIERLVAGFVVRATEHSGAQSIFIHLPDAPPETTPQTDRHGNPVAGG